MIATSPFKVVRVVAPGDLGSPQKGDDSQHSSESTSIQPLAVPADHMQLIRQISNDTVGAHATFSSPFGTLAMAYDDITASGKALQPIEDFIRQQVLPLYSNTHTTTSATGLQTTSFREEARALDISCR